MKRIYRNLMVVVALSGSVLVSCNKNSEDTGHIEIKLTDAPGPYEEVNIDIKEIRLNASSDENSGWVSLENANMGVYNLLDYQNGLDTLLGGAELPVGKLQQIRLVLGDNNTVVEDGVSHDLKVPSGSTSGLKLNVHYDIIGGITYAITMDFNAEKSIVKKGNGDYSLKPVIRTFAEATSGAISGSITPAETLALVHAIKGEDTLTTRPAEDGHFLVAGAPAGTYKVLVDVEASEEADVVIEDVVVVLETVTDLGTIELE